MHIPAPENPIPHTTVVSGACIDGRRVAEVAGHHTFFALIVVNSQGELLQVVCAPGAGRGFADLLHRRQQQANENRDDGNHNEQFNEGKTAPLRLLHSPPQSLHEPQARQRKARRAFLRGFKG